MSELVVKDVSMVFDTPDGGSVEALRNVNFSLKQGELFHQTE